MSGDVAARRSPHWPPWSTSFQSVGRLEHLPDVTAKSASVRPIPSHVPVCLATDLPVRFKRNFGAQLSSRSLAVEPAQGVCAVAIAQRREIKSTQAMRSSTETFYGKVRRSRLAATLSTQRPPPAARIRSGFRSLADPPRLGDGLPRIVANSFVPLRESGGARRVLPHCFRPVIGRPGECRD